MSVVGADQLNLAGEVIERAFFTLPLVKYKLRIKNGIDGSGKSLTFEDHGKDTFKDRIVQLSKAGAQILQSQDFAAIAIWFPPKVTVPAGRTPEGVVTPAFIDYFKKSRETKTRNSHVIGDNYWFLNTIARDPKKGSEGQGAVSELVRPYLELAKSQKASVVLEAIDEHAKDIYTHYGFETVDKFDIGQGEEVYPVYLMVYR